MAEPRISDNARYVLEARYLRRDEHRNIIESPQQLFERVALAVAEAEQLLPGPHERDQWDAAFYQLLSSLDFLPNSPTLMNAGMSLGQLSACFVVPVYDTMESIFDAVKLTALMQRTGGGTGFAFSRLRPKGAVVASTGGVASGPVSFMKIFDCVTENIRLGGKRRGANMGVMRVDHPDILEFISSKADEGILRNFNISVGATDAFMQAARDGGTFELINPQTGRATGQLNAREVFDRIVQAAWKTGDPGLLFLDAINRANPTPHIGQIEATNPCGEIPLLPYESCNLGSINLAHMLTQRNGRTRIAWRRLADTVRTAVRFLDDVIEVNRYPSPDFQRMAHGNRKIGLGVMGFAEMLIRLGVSYDSDAAVRLGSRIMRYIARASRLASRELASERGVYPFWSGGVHEACGDRVRNATVNAIAPTGTIGIIADTTAGIEPLFALAYSRHVLEGQPLRELTPLLAGACTRCGLDADEIVGAIMRHGHLAKIAEVPEDLRRLFVTALEIPPARHVQVQAAFQRYTDNSVSKTVNLPQEATAEDVAFIYRTAWQLGLKGVTIYRYGSKSAQVLQLGVNEKSFHYDHASRCDPSECRL